MLDVTLGTRPRYSLVVDNDVKKQTNNKQSYILSCPQGAAGAAPSAPPVGRGRARGMAARQAAAQQQQQMQQQQQQQPTPQQPQVQAEAAGAMVGGRGVQRGGGRERAGGNGGPPIAEMASMNLEGGGGGDAPQRRNPYDRYVDRQWKDEAISSKGWYIQGCHFSGFFFCLLEENFLAFFRVLSVFCLCTLLILYLSRLAHCSTSVNIFLFGIMRVTIKLSQ